MFRLRTLPEAEPGEPDTRSAFRYLLWICRMQWRTLCVGGVFGTVWMVGIGALPGAIGAAVDDGLAERDVASIVGWAVIIVALAVLIGISGVLRHRVAVINYLTAAYRTVQIATRHATRTGAALPRGIATGEVVSVGGSDTSSIGMLLDTMARTTGAIVAFILVAGLLLSISPVLGAVILIGLPLQALILGPLLRPLQRREHAYREQQGMLTSRANDIVAGLRVLRGIGGEELFTRRYAERSAQVRQHGVGVAAAGAVVKALQTLLPGLLLLAVTWLGARMAVSGAISTGQLVSVFGYTLFLAMPMDTFLETARKYTTAHAASRRIVRMLSVTAEVDSGGTTPMPRPIGAINDPDSGLRLHGGRLTALACAAPADAAAIADRLGRYTDSEVEIDGVAIGDIPLDQLRHHVMLADNDAHFFAGRLREQLDVHDEHDDTGIAAAVRTAAAHDAVDSLGGLDGRVEANARNVSGGQRQRLRLARALLHDPTVLLLVEPTSAVDAHTEALVARRLREHRRGRTTMVATTSPLMLEVADEVCFVSEGKVLATGTHAHLMEEEPRYRAVVTRDTGSEQEVAA